MSAFICLKRRMVSVLPGAIAVAMALPGAVAAESLPMPGLYRVEVRVALPNLQNNAPPMIGTICITPADLESGQAFFVLSNNPLKRCELLDYEAKPGAVSYRIACPGPNRGTAVASFRTTGSAYRGTIDMNMGGKNMTLSETQVGSRVGDCP